MLGIILADDNALVRAMIRQIVEVYPARIIAEAANGLDAVRAAEHDKPDLVILDISMPVMDGLTAAQHIRALYRDTPIIMVTDYSEDVYREEALRCGAQGYVLKRRAMTEIPAAMNALLGANQSTGISNTA